jgi:membrane protease YdiL (CAAX protease family)
MKKCPYCGKEYPDDVLRCLIDDEVLLGGESQVSPGSEEANTPALIPTQAAESEVLPPTKPWTDQQLRLFEVVLVCVIAFGGSILSSGRSLLDGGSGISSMGSSGSGTYTWLYHSLREASALGLLWYVLMRRGKSFSNLGLSWERKDIVRSIMLWVAGSLAFYGVYHAINFSSLVAFGHKSLSKNVGRILFGGGISFITILFQFLNPFFEELIARAYVMTEVKQLTNSSTKAIIASTVLQTSYHFYQGTTSAFALGALFLISSIYYAKTNRIAPVILAHLYTDLIGTFSYMFHPT